MVEIPTGARLDKLTASASRLAASLTKNKTATKPPEDKDQRIVQTPFGKGLVVRTRKDDGIHEICLHSWGEEEGEVPKTKQSRTTTTTASSSSSSIPKNSMMLYTNQTYPSIQPKPKHEVLTSFGRGRVVEVRSDDNDDDTDNSVVVVELSDWRLAGRSLVRCYLPASSSSFSSSGSNGHVQVVRSRSLSEMNAYERVRYAQELKALAAEAFRQKNHRLALDTYSSAVDAVRNVQHGNDSNNHVRADLVVVMITCCNNAGTCCIQLLQWDEAMRFAQSALLLLQALYQKRGMRIHTILTQQDGLTDSKLFGEWRVKSHLLQGRALMEKHRYQEALDALETLALPILDQYPTQLAAQEKQVRNLLAHCAQKRKHEKKLEKKRAQAMFGASTNNQTTSTTNGITTKKKSTLNGTTATTMNGTTTTAMNGTTKENQQESRGIEFTNGNHHYAERNKDTTTTTTTTGAKKKVSFSRQLEQHQQAPQQQQQQQYDDEEEEEVEQSWLEEHKEALILTASAGLAAAALLLLRKR